MSWNKHFENIEWQKNVSTLLIYFTFFFRVITYVGTRTIGLPVQLFLSCFKIK